MAVSLVDFYCIEMYILYTQYIYTLQVSMSNSGIIIHYIG